jgi:hypothetical protein
LEGGGVEVVVVVVACFISPRLCCCLLASFLGTESCLLYVLPMIAGTRGVSVKKGMLTISQDHVVRVLGKRNRRAPYLLGETSSQTDGFFFFFDNRASVVALVKKIPALRTTEISILPSAIQQENSFPDDDWPTPWCAPGQQRTMDPRNATACAPLASLSFLRFVSFG